MFYNGAEDRSLSTIIDGDIESKRSLLTKLYHAAYCQHEGYTEATKCPADPLCCASKRLFEHMSTCTDMNCGIPCCKSCRRVWRHYRKCRHPSACPMCSVVPSAYTSVGLAPRFTKVVMMTNTTFTSDRSVTSATTSVSMDSSINTSFGSTAAVVVVPPPRKKNGFLPPTFGKENATVVSDTSSVNSGWIPMDESRDQPQLDSSHQSSPGGSSSPRMDDYNPPTTTTTTAAAEATTMTPTRTTTSTTISPTSTPPPAKLSPVPSIPTPTTKKIGTPQSYPLPRKVDSPKELLPPTMAMMATTTSSSKPPLSPRRPQWALY